MNNLDYYRHKKILITGGTGYIATALIEKLQDIDCDLLILTRREISNNHPPKTNIQYYTADIREPELWPKILSEIDIIFYFAGQTSSKFANDNPLEDMETNVTPIIRLVKCCVDHNFSPAIIFAGTSTQVGFTDEVPVNEEHHDKPITIYDINKLTAEQYLLYYSNQLNKQAVSLRLSNVYGPGSPSSRQDRGILNMMVKRAVHNEPLTVYGDGNFLRDYIYIDDVVEAFLTAGQQMDNVKGNYYVIGSGKGYTIRQMMQLIQEQAKKKTSLEVTIKEIPFPAGLSQIEYRFFVADSSKFQHDTGWKAKVSLPEGINKTIDYFF